MVCAIISPPRAAQLDRLEDETVSLLAFEQIPKNRADSRSATGPRQQCPRGHDRP